MINSKSPNLAAYSGLKMKNALFVFILLLPSLTFGQEKDFKSIHREQQEYYQQLDLKSRADFDSLNQFRLTEYKKPETKSLQRRVFGYHPYWAGSNYLNYQWNLLTDLCFFSYEVDPYSGEPLNIYDWYTSEAVDSALANGVNVHLCVTLFSGHASFFGSATSQQTLINNVIEIIEDRGAQGINIDFEAVPSSQSNAMTGFLIELSGQFHAAIPGSQVSIAAPAVNWSNTFNIPVLNQYLDFFIVMGYDYYWNGSTQAGSVSPLYSMTGNYDYNFTKTVSYYQSQGVPVDKLIIGVPYYARQWPTQGQYAPSSTTGSGTAYTYRYIKDNSSGNYSVSNQHLEPNSRSAYYSFNSSGWNQCFLDEVYSMGKKYDLVNRRNLAGIGIWALGYDNGYTEMWELITTKFSDEPQLPDSDTIYDSGGPAFNYYNDEIYTYTLIVAEGKAVHLSFNYFDTEAGYDSLWIFDGPDTLSPPAGGYSGSGIPEEFISTANSLTLKFSSDGGITGQGWEAFYEAYPPSDVKTINVIEPVEIYPNPAKDVVYIKFAGIITEYCEVTITNSAGVTIIQRQRYFLNREYEILPVNIDALLPGLYFIYIDYDENHLTKKLLVL